MADCLALGASRVLLPRSGQAALRRRVREFHANFPQPQHRARAHTRVWMWQRDPGETVGAHAHTRTMQTQRKLSLSFTEIQIDLTIATAIPGVGLSDRARGWFPKTETNQNKWRLCSSVIGQ